VRAGRRRRAAREHPRRGWPDGRGLVVWDDDGDMKIEAANVDARALIKHG
jgi:hypothetical protein